MSEEPGVVWRQWSKAEVPGRCGEKYQAKAVEFALASIAEGYDLVVVKRVNDWLQKPATPKEWFAQFDNEPEPLLVAKNRGGGDKRPLGSGPWSPDEWTTLLETDAAVIAALSEGPKSVKAIITAVEAAGHEAPTPSTLRRHLKRLRFVMVGRSKTNKPTPPWGRPGSKVPADA